MEVAIDSASPPAAASTSETALLRTVMAPKKPANASVSQNVK